jgi:acyl-coenzyme A thioesterase PaaI-like protein
VEGNWHTGAIVAAVDYVCAMAIMSVEGIMEVSVHYNISYFTSAKLHVCTHHTTTSLPTTVFSPVSFSLAFILPSSSGHLKK